jgi:hypothetical protein
MDSWRTCINVLCKYTEHTRNTLGEFADLYALLDMLPIIINAIECIVPRLHVYDLHKIQTLLPPMLGSISDANLALPDECISRRNDIIAVLAEMNIDVPRTADDVCTHLISRISAMLADYTRMVIIHATNAVMGDIASASSELTTRDNTIDTDIDAADDMLSGEPLVAEVQRFMTMAHEYSYFAAMDDDAYVVFATAMIAAANYVLAPDACYNTTSATINRLRDIHCPADTMPAYVSARSTDWCANARCVADLMARQLATNHYLYVMSNPYLANKRHCGESRYTGRRPRGYTQC